MSKKISIITVNYNDKAGLEKTLKSITSQTWTDFEFLVIDGGSTDGSKELIESYADKIDYWTSEPDKGVYNAMNKGIMAAKGEFVIFMNGGDVFRNESVLENVEKKLVKEYDIYYGDNYKVSPGSKRKKIYPAKLSFSFFYTSSLNHQSTFIRRQLFLDNYLYKEDYKIAADWDFFIYTICKKNVPYKYLNMTISEYDFTGISSTEKYKSATEIERFTTFKEYFPLFIEDYKQVAELNSKRVKQIFHIKNHKIAWKILKAVISILLLFVPKEKK
jgi:glycosyltransferase involved in cell wall biosynthesis